MYCTKCGKKINKESKFCEFCGQKNLIKKDIKSKTHIENDEYRKYVWTCDYCGKEFNTKYDSDEHEVVCDSNPNKTNQSLNKTEINNKTGEEKIKPGLNGWLAVVGLSLIVATIKQIYYLFDYFSLFSLDWSSIPGFSTLLSFEFFASLGFILFCCYILYLYFKKSQKFPKKYIILLLALMIYGIIDLIAVSSINIPNQDLKTAINESISESSGNLVQNILSGIIWIAYMKKSKRVKVTFIE